MEERETAVFTGELVGSVDLAVTGGAEGGFIGGAKNRGFFFVANITTDLHFFSFKVFFLQWEGKIIYRVHKINWIDFFFL